MSKTALVIGATGLVGQALTRQLLDEDLFDRVVAFVRSPTGINDPKLKEVKTDFEHPGEVQTEIRGDVLFSCMGTTLRKAGSKEAQYKVDYTYQFEFARLAAENNVPDYLLISSPGATPDSMFFYSRIKGELDRDVKSLSFRRHIFVQPSILRGERSESRLGEQLAGNVIDGLSVILPLMRKYKSIEATDVASAMIRLYKDPEANGVYQLDELRK